MKHLSLMDGAFLHMESAEMPMHIGSLHIFEPPAGHETNWYEEVKAHVAKRMHLAAVFTRKLALMPFDLANPIWIEDDDIDLDYHIRHTVLPKPGTTAQLEALAARLHSTTLDRSRPLWEFYVIEGLQSIDGRARFGFYAKVHHAAVDGQAGVALASAVYDLTAEPRVVRAPRPRRVNRYQLGVAELAMAGLENQAEQVVELAKLAPQILRAAWAGIQAAVIARRSAGALDKGSAAAAAATPKAARRFKFAPATPFNTSITNQRRFAGVSLPLDEVKAIGRAHGASINDMVLWLCSTALRGYLKDSGELPEASLVAGVPVSLRAEGDTSANNQVTGTLLDLGTQVADPLQRLAAIMAASAVMKRQLGAFRDLIPTDFPSLGSPWLLSGLASLYGRSRIADRLRLANVTISNVPGPKVPLYMAGAKMLNYLPVSIVVHGVALNITVQSYMGQLCFGLIACRRAVPDLPELAQQLTQAFVTLQKLAVPVVEVAAAPVAPAVQVMSAAQPATAKKPRAQKATAPVLRQPAAKKTPVTKTRTRSVGKPALKIVAPRKRAAA